MTFGRRLHGWVIFSPWVITFGLFWLFPLGHSLFLSLTDYRLMSDKTVWIGLDNYTRLWKDPDFITALINTLIFVVGTIPVTTVIALGLALLINKHLPGRTLFRAAYFMPSVTSLVVVALVFSHLYARGGYLHSLAGLAGLQPPPAGFLLSPRTALPAIMAMDVWTASGYYMLLFLGGLQTIPEELYEAARIAGASRWQQFWYVTWPLLKPVTLLVIVINSIKSFQVFVEIFVMTKGGPLDATFTAVYFVYETGLRRFEFGYASAAAYLLFAIIALVSLAQFRLLRTRWRF